MLVSMLTRQEQMELGLTEEASLSKQAGIAFRSFPVNDRETPESTTMLLELVKALRLELAAGRTVATHCRASIGLR